MRLYHYTSLDALTGIVQKGGLCIRGTRYDSMNDPVDCKYAEEIVLPEFRKCLEEKGYGNGTEEELIFPYVASFSASEDDFHMWRMYHSEVAIELDDEWIKRSIEDDPFILFGECIYPKSTDEIHQAFCELFNKSEQCVNDLYLTAREQFMFIKRKEFSNEKEYRLCTYENTVSMFSKWETIDSEIPHDIKCKVRNGDLILYKEFYIAKCALLGIIINERDEERYQKVADHLRLWLLQSDYTEKINIRQSESGQKIINF